MSTTEVYQQCWKEWLGWYVQGGIPNNTISAPKLVSFWLIYLMLGPAVYCHFEFTAFFQNALTL